MHAHARRWHTSCDKTATSHSFYRHTIIKSRGRHYHATIRLHGCSFFFRRRVCSQWSRSSLTSFKTWLSNKKMKRATRWTMVDVGCLIPQMRSPISDVTNTMVAQNALLLILYVNITSWGPHYFELVRTHFRDFLSQNKKKKKKTDVLKSAIWVAQHFGHHTETTRVARSEDGAFKVWLQRTDIVRHAGGMKLIRFQYESVRREFGWVTFLVVRFLYKTNPNPRKFISCGKKVA